MRNTARELAPAQPQAASKLRDALGGMTRHDLTNRVQRTADWLRRGSTQLKWNGRGHRQGSRPVEPAGARSTTRAARADHRQARVNKPLRSTTSNAFEARLSPDGPRAKSIGPPTSAGSRDRGTATAGNLDSNKAGRQPSQHRVRRTAGQQSVRMGSLVNRKGVQAAAVAQALRSKAAEPTGGNQVAQENLSGDVGNWRSGGGAVGTAWNNVNTGNNHFDRSGRAAPDNSPVLGDPEAAYRQGMEELSQLHHLAQNDPTALKEIQDLVREMQRLDPKRFPGNPAMVEQLHTEVLTGVDKLELQLRHDSDDQPGQVRTTKEPPVPPGYEEAVAEYFRRLGKGQ